MTLTDDQLHLLAAYDPYMLADLVLNPDYGMSRIKSSHAGGTTRNGPEWLRWYSTGSGGIHGGEIGAQPTVTITYGQLAKWAGSVPPDVVAKLAANREEFVTERQRTQGWCRCPWSTEAPNDHSQPCNRYHPTPVEDNEHHANSIRINTATKVFVAEAIWKAADESDQLDLFEVTA